MDHVEFKTVIESMIELKTKQLQELERQAQVEKQDFASAELLRLKTQGELLGLVTQLNLFGEDS